MQKKFDSKAKAESFMSALETKAQARQDIFFKLTDVEEERAQLKKDFDATQSQIHELESLTPGPNLVSPIPDMSTSNEETNLRARFELVEEELRLTKQELEVSRSSQVQKQEKAVRRKTVVKIKQPPEPREIATPRPTKHYWQQEDSLRDPSEPEPTPAMQTETASFHSNPEGKTWPRGFIHRNAPTRAEGEGDKVVELRAGDFDVEKGWKKEVVRNAIKKEFKPRVVVAGSRVSVRSNKGVAPERLVNVNESDGGKREGKRRKLD